MPKPTRIALVGATGLIGQEIYSQALLAVPTELRLSNVVRDVLAP